MKKVKEKRKVGRPAKVERNAAIVVLRKNGASFGEIAKIFGIHKQTVAIICAKFGGVSEIIHRTNPKMGVYYRSEREEEGSTLKQ